MADCGNPSKYKIWEGHYRHGWDQDPTKGVKAHSMRLQFDGGVEHVDGSMWKIARLLPGKVFHSITLSTLGIPGVKIDLGCVGQTDCTGFAHESLDVFFKDFDLAAASCAPVACGPWYCTADCTPCCCPGNAVDAAACPPDPRMNPNFELSDMVLTLHGTPPACSTVYITFWYT